MKAHIYKITNSETSDVYVGSTMQTLRNRFKAHRSNARIGKDGRLYECMRQHGIEKFQIELLEDVHVETKGEIGQKERKYFDEIRPSLNMKQPNVIGTRKTGRIYGLCGFGESKVSYVGSTLKPIDKRLSDHKSASNKGTTPLYKFMREHGKHKFSITCLEDNIPIPNLIEREEHWIKFLNPPLNKNTHLTMTEQERDRLKYLKNREKRLKQVHERRLLKRDEINAQKKEHYKKRQLELQNAVIVPFDQHPRFTKDMLLRKTLWDLKVIAKRLSLPNISCLKQILIDGILTEQERAFPLPHVSNS